MTKYSFFIPLLLLLFTILNGEPVKAQTRFVYPQTMADLDDFFDYADENNFGVMIDCYTTWCGPCKAMAQNVFRNYNVAKYLNQNFICIGVDMDSYLGHQLDDEFVIDSYPTILLFYGDRERRLVGYQPINVMLSAAASMFQ